MFAGIGGFRSGLEKVGGFECVAYCEIDKYAKQAYEAMYDTEGETYFDDARKIDPERLPDFDLLLGGFPCQSFSIAGKRRGFEDTRGTLFFEIARIAAAKKPKYLLLENVPGLLSHDGGRTFAVILGALDELGYDVAWEVLNSADHNVPQSRKRVYIIGFLRGKRAGKVLSFTDANPKTLIQRVCGTNVTLDPCRAVTFAKSDFKDSRGSYIAGRDTSKQLSSSYESEMSCRVTGSAYGLSITLTGNAGGFGGDSPQCGEMSRRDRGDGRVARTGLYEIMGIPIKVKTKSGTQIALPGDSIDLSYPDINSRRGRVGREIAHTLTTSPTQGYYFVYGFDLNPDPKITELARCITTRQDNGISKRKGEKSGVIYIAAANVPLDPFRTVTLAEPDTKDLRGSYIAGRDNKVSGTLKVSERLGAASRCLPGEPMFTITVTDRHGVVYHGFIRKLMPIEAWRLQGFTDEQFNKVKATGMSDAQLYKQAGNAVTTNVIEALGRFIMDIEKEHCDSGKALNG